MVYGAGCVLPYFCYNLLASTRCETSWLGSHARRSGGVGAASAELAGHRDAPTYVLQQELAMVGEM